MGKNQHSKDVMHLTATEWRELGGKRSEVKRSYRPLPFNCCALSLQPFETPVCTPEGVLFDILNIFPYVQKHKKSPITGEALTAKELIRLNMAKNNDGVWHCPVTYKEFTDHSHVVAIKATGNVYAWQAVEDLNIKAKNWTDLLTGEPFTRKDIITIQDPSNTEHMKLRDISNFKHLQEMREEESAKIAATDQSANIRANATTAVVFEKFQREKREREEEEAKKAAEEAAREEEELASGEKKPKRPRILIEDLMPGKVVTSGQAAASFTSTNRNIVRDKGCREATEEEILEARWKIIRKQGKKGYVQLQTTHGNLNLEIHCDWTPRTGENFMGLCAKGYYDDVPFHRLVPGFCVQGGDPSGTGTGGESLWGPKPFKDEFDSRLQHKDRGILSMANSGPNTNKSQFFITFKGCHHLDNVHTVFGRVVGGLSNLDRMEAEEVNAKTEAPVNPIKIIRAVIMVNPIEAADKIFDEMLAERKAQREKAEEEKKRHSALGYTPPTQPKRTEQELADMDRKGFYSQPGPSTSKAAVSTGVGKYLSMKSATTLPKKEEGGGAAASAASSTALGAGPMVSEGKKKAPATTGTKFGDFSKW